MFIHFENGKRIEKDTNNEIRLVCFTCIDSLSIYLESKKIRRVLVKLHTEDFFVRQQ